MATKWTPAQAHAMETQGRNLLLSAAAGSGKTATLTARIIRSLTDPEHPADISRLLVVTFTRAAANELKTRISAALSAALTEQPGNRHLTRQLISLGSASICTIDSFCLSLVRANFQTLSLSPDFRLADETELAVLKRAMMDDLIEEYYDKKSDGEFAALADHFIGMRNDSQLSSILTEVYKKVAKYPEGMAFFENCSRRYEEEADLPFLTTHLGNEVKNYTLMRLRADLDRMEHAIAEITDAGAAQKAYEKSFTYDRDTCATLIEKLNQNDYEGVRMLLLAYAPIRVGSLKASEKTEQTIAACAVRNQVVKDLRDEIASHFALSEEKIPTLARATARVCREMHTFFTDYETRLNEEKRNRAVCDFGDITRMSYRLLVNEDGTPTDTAREIAERYDAIYIDEYQDVDAVQDAIFTAIAKPNNRFMVGDIKQSIYGFRGAEPSIFADYRRRYPIWQADAPTDNSDRLSESIYMSENFRCDRNVIRFVNAVCSYLFAACGESIGYLPQDDLIFSKAEPEGYAAPKVQVRVIVPPEKTDEEDTPAEAMQEDAEETVNPEIRYVVSEIVRLLHEGKKADGTPIRPKDIAILSRSTAMHTAFAEALEAEGIPASTAEQKDFFENPEVLLLLCLLNAIDNPTRDIPLAGVLRSPLFGFSMDDLVLIRSRTPDCPLIDALRGMGAASEDDPLSRKCREFEAILTRYRDMARTLPVDRLLRQLYRETCMLAYAGSGKEHRDRNAIRTRRTNLLRFYEYARRFESGSFKGLYQFISYVSGIIEEGTKIEFGGSVASDAVSIMTIHKSKGLEFPVCFLCGAGGYFNQSDVKNTLLFDRDMGLAIRIPDDTGFARLNTPMRLAIIARQNEKLREEEIRLLYVAMTRARERLYLTAKSRSSSAKLEESAYLRTAFGTDHRVALMDCHSYLEWTLAALQTGRGEDCFALQMLTPTQVDEYAQQIKARCRLTPPEGDTENEILTTENIETAALQAWRDRFDFRYAYEHLTTLPSKISVSDLHPGVLDEQLNIEAEDARFAEEDTQLRLQISGRMVDADTDSMIEKWLSRTPAFCQPAHEQEISAAERGTATHLFLQFCDMENARRAGVCAEAARLTKERFLPPYVAERIREEQLTRFFESDFYASLRRARRVWREQRFQLLLPADRFTENTDYARELSGESLLIQGVIDLFFEDEDGRLILCDYKTDALSVEERRNPALTQKKLSERHGRQLAYYAEALEQLCGRRPDQVVIYSLPLGETVHISV